MIESEVKHLQYKEIEQFSIEKNKIVKLTKMNNIFHIQYISKKNMNCPITNYDNDYYILNKTGELLEKNHIENRSELLSEVRQSIQRLRDYINYNVVDVKNIKWITLTYKENMQDTKKLYNDFKNFNRRLKSLYKYEYIVACEPQERGAWHMHVIMIFNSVAPYISNKIISNAWKQGFTKTQAFKNGNIDNLGAYLSAYLTDIELKPNEFSNTLAEDIKNVEIEGKTKRFKKGARLYLYPPKFNLYRISRGIKKPKSIELSYKEAKKMIGNFKPTYQKTLELCDSNSNFNSIVSHEYYNIKRSDTRI